MLTITNEDLHWDLWNNGNKISILNMVCGIDKCLCYKFMHRLIKYSNLEPSNVFLYRECCYFINKNYVPF